MTKDKTILIKNIYYMLSYAYMALFNDGYESVEKEEFHNIHNLFSAILSKGIALQLKQGLYREYVEKSEDIPTVRGKIDITGTVKNKIARKKLVSCEFDELSENNILNQIIKTTAILLIRHKGVSSEYKADLKKEMLYFSNVDQIDPSSIRWSSIRFQRNNANYRMLIGSCQLVIEGMLLSTDKGEYKLAAFLQPGWMNHLYEKFILEYYKKEHPELSAKASQIPWALDDGYDYMLPNMQTDITLTKDAKVLIIDAKYYSTVVSKHFENATVISGNLYQIFTYVKNKEEELRNIPHIVSGMLLYAKTDEEITLDNEYSMSGNKIMAKTLDLNVDFSEIKNQLDGIVNKYLA